MRFRRRGAMAGVYGQQGDAGVSCHEILVIRRVQGTLLLQLRHFVSALVAREALAETLAFPLLVGEPDATHFEGMSGHGPGADGMRVCPAVDDGPGEVP